MEREKESRTTGKDWKSKLVLLQLGFDREIQGRKDGIDIDN